MNRHRIRATPVAFAWPLLDALSRFLDKLGAPVRVRGLEESPHTTWVSTDELVREHFRSRSTLDHINFDSMLNALTLLGDKPSRIIETGMSAWGTNSTLLFSDYVATFGGQFWSVDIRIKPLVDVRSSVTRRTILTCGDSVRFLHRWVVTNQLDCKVDFVYLDSFDLDVEDPYPAALHGIRELFAIGPALKPGSLLLVDDTPATPAFCPDGMREPAERFLATEGVMPGKGMLIDRYLEGVAHVTKIHHGYQALYQFHPNAPVVDVARPSA